MARKGVFPIVATLAVVGVVLAVFSQTVMRDSNISTNTMTTEQAYADLSGKMKRIGVQEVSVNPQQLDVSEFLDAKDELPDIDSSYPFVVEGNGDVNIEIFSSGEKAAESGSDSFLTSMAKKFNAQHNKTSGDKTMSVSLRSVPSGTAAEYISTGKYQPECYTPSNTLFGELVKNEGVELTVEADRLAGNVAGILVSKKTGDMLRSEYGDIRIPTRVQRVSTSCLRLLRAAAAIRLSIRQLLRISRNFRRMFRSYPSLHSRWSSRRTRVSWTVS